MTLDELRLFVSLAEEGSLTAGGRRVGLGPGGASAALRRIEGRARVRLVERSTRSLRLTPEGEQFLRTCREMLAVWERGELALQTARQGLAGALRVTAPIDLAEQFVAGWVASFVRAHPEIRITLLTGDAVLPIPAEAIDVAIRYGLSGEVNHVVRRLGVSQRVLVASPGYLDRAGRPRDPQDLSAHRCLAWLRGERPFTRWTLLRGDEEQVHTFVPSLCGDGGLVRRWAVEGEGIAWKGSFDVWADLRAGRLERVLPDWHGVDLPLVAVTPGRKNRVARVQALIDFLATRARELTT